MNKNDLKELLPFCKFVCGKSHCLPKTSVKHNAGKRCGTTFFPGKIGVEATFTGIADITSDS